jgi:hypothetical protein
MNSDPRSVEDELSTLKVDVAVIRSNHATKVDLHELRLELRLQIEGLRVELHDALRAQTWRVVGVFSALLAISHVATRFGY